MSNSMQTASRNLVAKHALAHTPTIRSVASFDSSESSPDIKHSPFSSSTISNTSAASTSLPLPADQDKVPATAYLTTRSASSTIRNEPTYTNTTTTTTPTTSRTTTIPTSTSASPIAAAPSRWSANGVRVIEQPPHCSHDTSILSDAADPDNGQWDSTIGKAGLGKTGRVINKLVSDNDALKREIQIERLRAEEAKQAAKLIEDKMERMMSEYQGKLLEANVTKTLLARKERQVESLTATVDVEKKKALAALDSERTWKQEMQQVRDDTKQQVERATMQAQLMEGRYNAIASHWRDQGQQVTRAVGKMRTEIAEIVDERARDDDRIQTLRDLCEQQDSNIRALRREKDDMQRLFDRYKQTQDDDLRDIRINAKRREDEQEKILNEARDALDKLKWALNVKKNVKGAQ